jgi:hypothetical protein
VEEWQGLVRVIRVAKGEAAALVFRVGLPIRISRVQEGRCDLMSALAALAALALARQDYRENTRISATEITNFGRSVAILLVCLARVVRRLVARKAVSVAILEYH